MMQQQRTAWQAMACAALALTAVIWAPTLAAQERIALIVTNQNYPKELKLTNTHADGKLVKEALEAVGFTVWEARDTASRGELERVIGEHVARLANTGPDAIGFLYYSGHGAADGPRGRNFLIPTEANVTHAAQLPLSALSVEQIVDAVAGAGGKMSFVVFDACRNVPLQRADKSTFKGFAPFRQEPGLLIAYATEAGNVAVDENLYARALAEEIRQPGREAGSAFRAVSRRVYDATEQRQRPDYVDRRFDDFVFKPAAPQVAVGTFPERPAPALACDGVDVALSPSGSQCIKPGSGATFRDCWPAGGKTTCGPQMAVLPPGKYLRGSPDDESRRDENEGPRQEVAIGRAFAVGRTHVTRGEFADFVAATGHKTDGGCYTWSGSEWKSDPERSWRSPGFNQTDDHPVVCVNWQDANAYAKWLSAGTGKTYRLLTEAESEYAARGTTVADSRQPRYFFGNDEKMLCSHANGADETAKEKFPNRTLAPCKDNYVFTAPVGRFKANAFGLHGAHGNAWSWTQDCWNENYNGVPSDGTAWTSGDCSRRVLRGGSWVDGPQYLRSACRFGDVPGFRSGGTGFRVSRTLNP